MGWEEWLQSGKWRPRRAPEVGDAADRAFQKVGGAIDRSRRTANKATGKAKEQIRDAYERLETDERFRAAKERMDVAAGKARESATGAVEVALRYIKEKPAARLFSAGVQIKAGLTGFGAGYLFPDLEILFLGVGGRGRWLARSGIPVWGAERLTHYLLVERAPDGQADTKGSKWDVRKQLYGTVAAPLLTGFSAGLGLRLVQDALDLKGLPDSWRIIVGGRAMIVERIWMLGNGIWCFAMGKDLLMVTLGRTKGQSIADVLRRLRDQGEADLEDEEGDGEGI